MQITLRDGNTEMGVGGGGGGGRERERDCNVRIMPKYLQLWKISSKQNVNISLPHSIHQQK